MFCHCLWQLSVCCGVTPGGTTCRRPGQLALWHAISQINNLLRNSPTGGQVLADWNRALTHIFPLFLSPNHHRPPLPSNPQFTAARRRWIRLFCDTPWQNQWHTHTPTHTHRQGGKAGGWAVIFLSDKWHNASRGEPSWEDYSSFGS